MLKRHAEPRVSIRRVPYNTGKHATGPGSSSRRLDLTRVESPLNWPAGLLAGGAGNSADGTPLASADPEDAHQAGDEGDGNLNSG